VEITVDEPRCISCGICVTLAPAVMGLDNRGKAYARTRIVEWSPADGGFVHECPTLAINAKNVDRRAPSLNEETQRDPTPSGAGAEG
jgi:ferredoxin